MDYLDYYSFREEPFSNSHVPKFFYNSTAHSHALLKLHHAANAMKGLAVCIGDIGTGKTTLARMLLDKLHGSIFHSSMIVIVQANVDPTWFFKRIAFQLGIDDPSDHKSTLMNQIYTRLFELHDLGKKPIVIIDEAQMLRTKEIMEEIRGILNLEVPGKRLITFILFALPDLERYLRLDPPLAQRVAMKFNLSSLDINSTHEYIKLRLDKAGGYENLFTSKAMDYVYKYSKGTPRLINIICDNALVEGSLFKARFIEEDIIANVAQELSFSIDASADYTKQKEDYRNNPHTFIDTNDSLEDKILERIKRRIANKIANSKKSYTSYQEPRERKSRRPDFDDLDIDDIISKL
ncbi:MAG: AAA family ATPase [Pseudomonadota bacterium]